MADTRQAARTAVTDALKRYEDATQLVRARALAGDATGFADAAQAEGVALTALLTAARQYVQQMPADDVDEFDEVRAAVMKARVFVYESLPSPIPWLPR